MKQLTASYDVVRTNSYSALTLIPSALSTNLEGVFINTWRTKFLIMVMWFLTGSNTPKASAKVR